MKMSGNNVFKSGRDVVEDLLRSGRPLSSSTEVNIAKVKEMVTEYRHLRCWTTMDKGLRKFLPVEVGISTSEAHEINIKPVAASSPSRCKISMLELGKP